MVAISRSMDGHATTVRESHCSVVFGNVTGMADKDAEEPPLACEFHSTVELGACEPGSQVLPAAAPAPHSQRFRPSHSAEMLGALR